MPHASAPELSVLLSLRLLGRPEVAEVSRRTGLSEERVAEVLGRAEATGWVLHRDRPPVGWRLTPGGRDRVRALALAELDEAGVRAAVDDAYRSFLALDPELKAAVAAWQVRAGDDGRPRPNDHADPDHDEAAVAALGRVDDGARPVCASLAGALHRFAGYGDRLAGARHRVEAGDGAWFADAGIDSYHTVWFELHEHLLASLGRERADEHPAVEESRP